MTDTLDVGCRSFQINHHGILLLRVIDNSPTHEGVLTLLKKAQSPHERNRGVQKYDKENKIR